MLAAQHRLALERRAPSHDAQEVGLLTSSTATETPRDYVSECNRLERAILDAVPRFSRLHVGEILREYRRDVLACAWTVNALDVAYREIRRGGADPFVICEFALGIPPGHPLRERVRETFAPVHCLHNRAWKLHRVRPGVPRTPRTFRATRATRTTTARRSASGPRRASAPSASGDDPGEPGEPSAPAAHRHRSGVERHLDRRTVALAGGER